MRVFIIFEFATANHYPPFHLEQGCDEQLEIKSLGNATYYINYGNSSDKFIIE